MVTLQQHLVVKLLSSTVQLECRLLELVVLKKKLKLAEKKLLLVIQFAQLLRKIKLLLHSVKQSLTFTMMVEKQTLQMKLLQLLS
ncbi:hypothetical protein D3C85_1285010 [compost metagenome]